MKRRNFLQLGALAVPSVALGQVLPDVLPQSGFDLRSLKSTNVLDLRSGYVNQTGRDSPQVQEVDTALDILEKAPSGIPPFRIAEYFWNLKSGLYNTDEQPNLDYYAREWPVRANPLIVGFFAATDYGRPSGDTTAWCSAFVNWVLERSANGKTVAPMPTRSAASNSFRNWGQVTSGKTQATSGETGLIPRKGDIAVFRNTTGNTNSGHVAFFVEFNASRTHLLILGGNQLPKDKSNTGEINMKWFPVDGKTQVLDSIRTADWLHKG